MARVHKSTLPTHAHLWTHHRPGDFLDCYGCDSPLSVRDATALAMAMPGWAKALLGMRDRIVTPFGLRRASATPKDAPLFPVTHESEDELNFGFDDRHLDFRIALLRDRGRIYLSTWVHPHNRLGRAYLALVMPFHVLIVRSGLNRVARAAPAA